MIKIILTLSVCIMIYSYSTAQDVPEGLTGKDSTATDHESLRDSVYFFVDQILQFKDGEDGWNHFIRSQMHYPDYEMDHKIMGTVYVELIVEKDGSTSGHRIMRGVPKGPGLDQEALKICKLLRFETPAIYKGEKVRYRMVIPMKFTVKK